MGGRIPPGPFPELIRRFKRELMKIPPAEMCFILLLRRRGDVGKFNGHRGVYGYVLWAAGLGVPGCNSGRWSLTPSGPGSSGGWCGWGPDPRVLDGSVSALGHPHGRRQLRDEPLLRLPPLPHCGRARRRLHPRL